MADNDMVFQSYTNSENVLVGSYGETYPACPDDQAVHIKAEEVSDSEGEVDSVPITVQEMKAEPEVSCMSLNDSGRQISRICKNASCVSYLCLFDSLSSCTSVCLCTRNKSTVLPGFLEKGL
jgi:hypothetical protein